MVLKHAATAALAVVTFAALNPHAALAAAPAASAGGFQTITQDKVSIQYQRVAASTTPRHGTGETRADFDGDGIDDLAAGANSGAVVRYSSAPWTDYFANKTGTLGRALVAGDFDHDGYDDLVIGDPEEVDPTTKKMAGGLWIAPGSPAGLNAAAIRHLNQSTPGVTGTSNAVDGFAGALAAGDLNGDGRDDLAVGVPGKTVGSARDAGAVLLFLGSAQGVSTTGARRLDQGTTGVPGTPETNDEFGQALAIGRFDKDPYADLVIGSPFENSTAPTPKVGTITVVPGAAGGPAASAARTLGAAAVHKVTRGVEPGIFGLHLAVGDLNGDGAAEIVIGDRAATVAGHDSAGAVFVVPGGNSGLIARSVTAISQNTAGVPGAAETYDGFGEAVAIGDATGDGFGDVVVGTPGEDIDFEHEAGGVTLLRGSATGLTGVGATSVKEPVAGKPSTTNESDEFGNQVAILNLDGTGKLDVAVAASQILAQDKKRSGKVLTYLNTEHGLSAPTITTGSSLTVAGMDVYYYGISLAAAQSTSLH